MKEPKLPIWRRLRRRGYYLLSLGLLAAVRALPRGAGRRLCASLAWVGLRVRRRERLQAAANLSLVLADWDDERRAAMMRLAARRMGENLYDTLRIDSEAEAGFPRVSDDGVIETIERLRRPGRGVLILTGHFGCWEMLGAWLAHRLDGLAVVTGTVHNEAVARLLARRRRRLGMTPLPRQGDLRPLMRALREGRPVAVLMDQATRVENLSVPFCGRPAPTPAGFAKLARRYGAPVVPVAIGREGAGHRVRHLPAILPADPDRPIDRRPGRAGDVARDLRPDESGLRAFLRTCNGALEELLRGNLAEWVWFHRRWPDWPPRTTA